jgi:hypothetical protein
LEGGEGSQVLYWLFPPGDNGRSCLPGPNNPENPLIPLWFDVFRGGLLLRCNKTRCGIVKKDFIGELFITR